MSEVFNIDRGSRPVHIPAPATPHILHKSPGDTTYVSAAGDAISLSVADSPRTIHVVSGEIVYSGEPYGEPEGEIAASESETFDTAMWLRTETSAQVLVLP